VDTRLRALNRFGLGARVGERDGLSDSRGWLRRQLSGAPPVLPAPDGASPDAIGDALRGLRGAQQDPQARQIARRRIVQIAAAESHAALTARVTSERPFVERLVAFWSNHLCVSAGAKALVAPLAGSYERDAIRPHVLGRFEEMVLASATHPAMLVYLDNFQSIGPASPGARLGQRAGARRGLNENYARELLELHTLGVNGGYTQQDVQELARILTGWTVGGLAGGPMRTPVVRPRARPGMPPGRAATADLDAAGPIRFTFAERLHEPGAKTVLGTRYGEAGVAEGEHVIRALCRHPATATFVATKLVAHFIDDDPPAGAVERVARTFRESDGDLRRVADTLIDLPEAWSESARKFRTPQDWLVAVFRAFRSADVNERVVPILRQLRHPLWSPQAPKGFGDTTQEWSDPDSLLNRAELARTLARRIGAQRIDPRLLLDVIDVAHDDPLHGALSDTSIQADERVALALAGPAFQWR
jgi:uncharacterized protein (DUF1800 family)